MRLCPNCGQDVASGADRFCPNCGVALPVASGAASSQQAYQQAAPGPSAQPTRPPVYTAPNPGGYSAPSYTTGTGGANLPLPRPRRAPGGSQSMKMLRSLLTQDVRVLLIAAAVIVAIIVAVVIVLKIVAWFFSLWWLWLILLVALGYGSQRRRRRGRWLP